MRPFVSSSFSEAQVAWLDGAAEPSECSTLLAVLSLL